MGGCLLLALPAMVRVLRTVGLRAWVLALAVPFLLGLWLPISEFEISGHARLLFDLIHDRSDVPAEEWLSVRPGVQGLAFLLPRLLPPEASPQLGETYLLLMNRWALTPLLLGVAAASTSKVQDRSLGLITMLLTLASPALVGWSATAHFLTPSLALGALGLAVGLRGMPGAALALAVVAHCIRPEGMLLAAVGVAAGVSRKRSEPWVIPLLALLSLIPAWLWSRPWGGILAHQVFQRGDLYEAARDGSGANHIFANVHAFFLGGPWSAPLPILGVLVLSVWVARKVDLAEAPEVRPLLLGAGFLFLLFLPLILIDFGARSRLPASVLAPVLVIRCATMLDRRAKAVVLLVLSILVAVPSIAGFKQLDRRWMTASVGPPGSVELADARDRWSLEALEETGCVLVWGGINELPGARSADESPDLDHLLIKGLYEGGCVFWIPAAEGFYGDARQERLDRARMTLGLEVSGWFTEPPYPVSIVWSSQPELRPSPRFRPTAP